MKLSFFGANHQVTGSRTLLEWNEGRFLLVDDGMIQGHADYETAPLPVSPKEIEYVLLTHAHIDHSGMLPLLVRQGFSGKIYSTQETMDLCAIMLADSASIQEKDALSSFSNPICRIIIKSLCPEMNREREGVERLAS